jgi:hypothetical protein
LSLRKGGFATGITRLRKDSTARALKRDPQFAALFVEYLLSRVVRIDEELVDQFMKFQREATGSCLVAVWANN